MQKNWLLIISTFKMSSGGKLKGIERSLSVFFESLEDLTESDTVEEKGLSGIFPEALTSQLKAGPSGSTVDLFLGSLYITIVKIE